MTGRSGLEADREFKIRTELVRQQVEAGQSVAGKLASWQTTIPNYAPPGIRNGIELGYIQNTVVYACINGITRNFAKANVIVENSETSEISPGHELPKVIALPTNVQSASDRWTQTLQDLMLTGNAFWELVRGSASGKVIQIWRMNPQQVAIVPDSKEWIKEYLYEINGQWWPVEKRNVIHFRFPDPRSDRNGGACSYFGIPPILSAKNPIQVDNHLFDQLKVTLDNHGVPSMVVESGDDTIQKHEADAFRRRWREIFSGKDRGDPLLLPGGMKVKVVGMGWNEMAIDEVAALPQSRIAMALGYPDQLLNGGDSGGLPGSGGSRLKEANEQLWSGTILPLMDAIAELLSARLLPEFDGRGSTRVAFDTSSIKVLRDQLLEAMLKASELFSTGLYSRHQAIALAGGRIHGEDVFSIPTKGRVFIKVEDEAKAIKLAEPINPKTESSGTKEKEQ